MTTRGSQDERDESAAAPGDARQETRAQRETLAQRDHRNLSELVQELRVAGLGIQVIFGFLLSMPFAPEFHRLSGPQRELYITCVVLSAVATALLAGPVAYHRLVFRRGMQEDLVRFANVLAIAGLAAVGLAVLAAVLLVTWYTAGPLAGGLITAVAASLFGGLWFAVPLTWRNLRR